MLNRFRVLSTLILISSQLFETPLSTSGFQTFDDSSSSSSGDDEQRFHLGSSSGSAYPSPSNRHQSDSLQDGGRPKKFLYFAYGSNMWSNRIRINNPSAVRRGVGFLRGFRLEFANYSKRWQGAVANIIEDSSSHVYGVLWELDLKHLKSLDRQEGVGIGIYERFRPSVRSNGRSVRCWSYKLTAATRAKSIETHGPNGKPSSAYKNVIIKGAIENKLPFPYIDQLNLIPVNGFMGAVDDNGLPV